MRKILLLLAMFMGFSFLAFSQTGTVTGTVMDETGAGVPFASITIKGTTTGVSANADGNFSIKTSEGATLVFSATGYATQEVIVHGNTVNAVLQKGEGQIIDEVVVVGYGKTTKTAFTGTAKVVGAGEIEKKDVSNLSQALAGEVSGLRVINTSGQPGTVATIRIRGFGSVNGNRDPLYVVDGVPFAGSLNSINPDDIESATVLKDATATAIYGSRGANGVIVITTKSGRGKKSYIQVDGKIGSNMSLLPRYKVITSPEQYISLSWEALYNQGVITGEDDPAAYANENLFSDNGISPVYNMWNVDNISDLIDPATKQVRAGVTRKYDPERWEDYAFQSSIRHEVNLQMGGSNEKTNYFTSLGYLKDVGYLINSDYERATARLNLNQQVKSWLSSSISLNYAMSKTNRSGQNEDPADSRSVFWFVDNIPPIYPLYIRDANGNYVSDPIFGGNQYDYGDQDDNGRGFGGFTNAIADAHYNINRHKRNEINGSVNFVANLAEGLTFEPSAGVQYYSDKYVDLSNKFYGSAASQNGSIYQRRSEMAMYNVLELLRYKRQFGSHNLELLAAHENSSWKLNILDVSKYNLVEPYNEEFNNAIVTNPTESYTNNYALESYFVQANYDFDRKYFLSGTIRRDGSSRFVKDKWGTFGSVGAAWMISNESFMAAAKHTFKMLKLKASYGLTGEQSGIGYYPGYDLYDINNLNDGPAFSFNTKGNPDLTWETSRMFQAGVEFQIKDFLTGSIDYYNKNTVNLLFDRRVGPSIGYALITVNDGRLRNQGIEFDLTGHLVKTGDFSLDLGVNGEVLKNKLLKMPIDPVTGKQKPLDIQTRYGRAVGYSIYDFYLREYAGVNDEGASTWTLYYNDLNGNGEVDDNESVASLTQYLYDNPDIKESQLKKTTTTDYSIATQFFNGKSAIPKLRGGINLNTGYKGLTLGIQFLYSIGGYAYDAAYAVLMDNDIVGHNNWHVDILNRWQNAGDKTDVPRLSNKEDANVNSGSTRFLTKAGYLALNNVRLGYTLPNSILEHWGVSDCNFWVSGDNLWLHSARAGFNPSTDEAGLSDMYRYSPLSTISVGVRLKF